MEETVKSPAPAHVFFVTQEYSFYAIEYNFFTIAERALVGPFSDYPIWSTPLQESVLPILLLTKP